MYIEDAFLLYSIEMKSLSRMLKLSSNESFLLLGPRGTGKTSLLKKKFPDATYFDLLEDSVRMDFLARPGLLESRIPATEKIVIIDEVQKAPDLLNEVHRLIEKKKTKFILTGSSARKLRRYGTNLLAGRALTRFMHPFSSAELGDLFQLEKALELGMLPKAYLSSGGKDFLKSYVGTYLREEVSQEGLVRSLENFSRFLQVASFSQASILNVNGVAQEAGIGRQAAKGYFEILLDLLLSVELPVFSRRAKRELVKHKKFYFFDAGVFRSLRPRGPLDSDSEINGAAMETLVLQELRALNDALFWDLEISFWRSLREKLEVDFVLYGPGVFTAIEVKASSRIRPEDFKALFAMKEDYPKLRMVLLYGGTRKYHHEGVDVWPLKDWFALDAKQKVFA